MEYNDSEEFILKKVQAVGIELLNEVDRICKQHKLTYYLMYGSLIGAIRHKGFIPWDDDIDIAMPRKDFELFREKCPMELRDDYYLQDYPSEPHYSDNNIHIRKKGTTYLTSYKNNYEYKCEGIWMDIWPLDYFQKREFLGGTFRIKKIRVLTRLANARAYANLDGLPIKNKIAHFLLKPIKLSTILRIRKRTCMKYDFGDYLVNCVTPYPINKEKIPKEYYGIPKPIQFGDRFYLGPACPEMILKQIYGDYMTPPPESERKIYHKPLKIEF